MTRYRSIRPSETTSGSTACSQRRQSLIPPRVGPEKQCSLRTARRKRTTEWIRIDCVKVRLRASLSEQRGASDGPSEEVCCRSDRHVLAHVRWLRLSGHRGWVSAGRDRALGRLAGLRPYRPHD